MAYQTYDYIAELYFDSKSKMYDLFLTTFNGGVSYTNIKMFLCTRKHAGRLDLVSQDIYDSQKWVGSLCTLNDIMNQHSIRDGDLLFYLPVSELSDLMKVPNNIAISQAGQAVNSIKNDLLKALKKKKPDGLRKNYLNNREEDKLPPTVFTDSAPQIVVNNSKILIAPNLFTNPNKEVLPVEEETTTNNIVATQDDMERILVKRYIKLASNA